MLGPDADSAVQKTVSFLTLYVVAAAVWQAISHDAFHGYQRGLLLLTVAAMLDNAPGAHAALRETGLMVVRGVTVTALFVASADYGPTPEQAATAGRDLFIAAAAGSLVLLGQARRAAEDSRERRQLTAAIAALAEALRTAPATPAGPVPVTSGPSPVRWQAVAAAAAAGALVSGVMRRRSRG